MKLKKKYKTKDDIPEKFLGLFEEKDGEWHLDEGFEGIEGVTPKPDKLDEFRETNRRLLAENQEIKSKFGNVEKQVERMAEMEAQLKQFEGVSGEQIEHLRKLAGKEQDAKVRQLLETGDLDAALEARFGRKHQEMKTEMEALRRKVEDTEHRRMEKEQQLASIQAKTKFKSLITSRGLRLKKGAEDALDMFIDTDWTVTNEGDLELKRKDLLGDDGGPMKGNEYLERELLERKSFLFEPAKGGGGEGSNEGGDQGNGKIIARDPYTIGMNLDAIAKGDAHIRERPEA